MPAQKQNPFDTGLPLRMDMSDDALATIDPSTGAFLDTGFMPVNALTIAGKTQDLPGGGMDRMFIHYTATGVQNPQTGVIDYTGLNYELYAYNGQATFGRDPQGNPTASGPGAVTSPLHELLLAHGSLIQGQLAFGPNGIGGEVDVTVQVGDRTVGRLDISVLHGLSDIGHTSAGGLTLTGGALHATFVPLTGS